MRYTALYRTHLDWVEALTANAISYAPPPSPHTDEYRADLAGLLSTAYVAAFECCVKEIFRGFSRKNKKNKLLSNIVEFNFAKINNKIHYGDIISKYTAQFGNNYKENFKIMLDRKDQEYIISHRISIKKTYDSLLTWRHAFAHEGKKLATLEEVSGALPVAREVIFILDRAMSR